MAFGAAWRVGFMALRDESNQMRFTTAEYQSFLSRSGQKQPTPKSGCDRESELHSQIFEECRRRGWIALHGSMSGRTSRTLGEPDFVILGSFAKNAETFSPRVWLIECKTRTGKLSPAQAAMQFHAAKLGHKIHVVRSFGDFLDVINL